MLASCSVSLVMGKICSVLYAELTAKPVTHLIAPAGKARTSVGGEAWCEWEKVAEREKQNVPRHRCSSLGTGKEGVGSRPFAGGKRP